MNQDSTDDVSRHLSKAVYVRARSQRGRQKRAGLVEVQVQVGIFFYHWLVTMDPPCVDC